MPTQASMFKADVVTVTSTTPVAITLPFKPRIGVQLKAETGNTGIIFVGGPEVTTTTGYPLDKTETVFLPFDQDKGIYAIAGTNGDKIRFLVF